MVAEALEATIEGLQNDSSSASEYSSSASEYGIEDG
jgi:hypothetical protein